MLTLNDLIGQAVIDGDYDVAYYDQKDGLRIINGERVDDLPIAWLYADRGTLVIELDADAYLERRKEFARDNA